MMDSQKKSRLMKFTTAAKYVIFDAARMRQFLPMLDTGDGAIKAVQTVIGAIELKYPVPRDIAPLLAMNIYMLLVDMAQEIAGVKPDKRVVIQVAGAVMKAAFDSKPASGNAKTAPPAAPQPQRAAARPAGLMGA